MATAPTDATVRRRPRPLLGGAIASFLVAATLLTTTVAAGAQGGCGEYSFGFTGTRFLNDGISDSAGPFPIDLPAGTYDVTLWSHDGHDDHPGQVEQTAEQWRVVLDSGWTSGPSLDIPLDQNTTTTVFAGQQIPASTSISVEHVRVGGINSVDVVCVGFTPVAAAAPATVEPETAVAAPDDESSTEEISTEISDSVTVENEPVTAVAGAVEVAQAPDAAPQLALTGPSARMRGLVVLALGMIALGGVLVWADSRSRATVRA